MQAPVHSLGAALCLLVLGGCAASASPGWDARFGERTRALQAQQLIEPQAPVRNDQTQGKADGRTVREAMDRQVDSFKSPPPSNVINIGVGGGASGR